MFQTNPVLLDNLLNQVDKGDIQLPDFQRGWVWDDDRIKGLLISICRGFPIGAVMTLSAGGEIRLKARPIEGVDDETTETPDNYLLDGQQRLTSLYQALRYPGPVDTHDTRNKRIRRWYYIDMKVATEPDTEPESLVISVPEDKRITRDFGREELLNLSTREREYKEHKIPTEQMMRPLEWIMGYLNYWKEEASPECDAPDIANSFTQTIVSQFSKYQLPVISLSKETPKEAVCAVFEKVNTGGVTLNVFELVTASFAADAEHFSLRDDWEKRKKRLYNSLGGVLQGVDGNQFLQAVALLKTQEDRRVATSQGKTGPQAPAIGCRRRDILSLNLEDYLNWADKVEQGFISAGSFLISQFVFGQRNVPYGTQLVPLAVLFVELDKELDPYNAKQKLEQWYWSGVFGEAYGGTVETQFALDLEEVASWIRGGPSPRLVVEATFTPERLLTLRTRNSAAYKGLYALQMKNGAADWRTNEQLLFMTFTDQSIDIHHIYPQAWCEDEADPRVPPGLYNSVINKTPIDAVTNRIIGRKAPSVYMPILQKLISPVRLDAVLESHWIDPALLHENDFAQSFVKRGEMMLSLIGQAMGRDLGSGRDIFTKALTDAGVAEGDFDDEDEFGEFGVAS
ncbi:MAG: DUF262 domain-containing protein [Gemmatimonadota bacterium]|nr:DUF262 domain-containing protein [Gemmatimonadota bacterium]